MILVQCFPTFSSHWLFSDCVNHCGHKVDHKNNTRNNLSKFALFITHIHKFQWEPCPWLFSQVCWNYGTQPFTHMWCHLVIEVGTWFKQWNLFHNEHIMLAPQEDFTSVKYFAAILKRDVQYISNLEGNLVKYSRNIWQMQCTSRCFRGFLEKNT